MASLGACDTHQAPRALSPQDRPEGHRSPYACSPPDLSKLSPCDLGSPSPPPAVPPEQHGLLASQERAHVRYSVCSFQHCLNSFSLFDCSLSSRLQRTDRLLPHTSFHPYARPSGSRSPSPPPTVEILPTRPRTRSISSSEASSDRPSTPRRLFRNSATPPPPQSLKRAPSFGAASIKSRAQYSRSSAPPESGSYSSDEEEKARQAIAKRPRTGARRVPSFFGAPLPTLAPSPEEEILDPLVVVPEDPVFAPTVRKSLPPPPRRSTKAAVKPSTPKPAAAPAAPAPAAAATPRTLRRIGTRSFGVVSPAPRPVTPVAVDAPVQPRKSPRTSVAPPRKSGTSSASTSAAPAPGPSDEERRRERRERKERRECEKAKEMQPEGARRVKKRTLPKEPKPSVAPMRL
jgi:hypothetical protein